MFVYRGVVTNENSVPLLMLLEKEMETSEFGFIGRKRLFMFVLESLQNVSRHSNVAPHSNMSLVVYSKVDSGYTVTTANVISTANTMELRKRLDEINNLQIGRDKECLPPDAEQFRIQQQGRCRPGTNRNGQENRQ